MKNLIRKLFLVKEISSRYGEVHFRRYRIISSPWFNIYIHHILKSDEDLHPHSHPFDFISIILYGGYEEVRHINTSNRLIDYLGVKTIVKWFTSFKYNEFHKIKLLKNSCVTLVFTGPRITKDWGYLTEKGFIQHEEYRKRKNNGEFK
jgi:hypothetical protein